MGEEADFEEALAEAAAKAGVGLSALHFTTARLTTLDLYPGEIPLGFDIAEYKELCRERAYEDGAAAYARVKDALLSRIRA